MDRQILRSFDKNIKGKFSYLPRQIEQMWVRSEGGLLLIDSGLHSTMFNIVCCDGVANRSSIRSATDYFRSKNLPYAFWVGFAQDPPWLEEELLALDLITDETEWAMICDLDKPISKPVRPGLDIRPVRDREGIHDISSVLNGVLPSEEHQAIQSFYEQSTTVLLSGDCLLTFFVGYMDNRPTSLSSLYCDEGMASIFDVVVLPEMCGKGLGKAMTVQAMRVAQERGFSHCILTATNDAKYLYQKLGFESFKTMKVYCER